MMPLWLAILASLSSFAVAYFGYWLSVKPRLYVYVPISPGFWLPPAQNGAEPVGTRAGQVIVRPHLLTLSSRARRGNPDGRHQRTAHRSDNSPIAKLAY